MHASISNSSATMSTAAVQDPRSELPNSLHSYFGEAAFVTWLPKIVICLMLMTLLALWAFPIRRTFANVEVNYNEGWNAYRAAMVTSGTPLYGAPPKGLGTITAYPPLSFHLVGLLGSASTFTVIGRLVSLISLIAAGVFVGLIVRRGASSWLIAVFSFLLYEIAIALLRADRIGMYDPQLLGEALSTAGLYFYFRNPISSRLLCTSALFFCLAGFTKHNLIIFPAAVAIDLLLRSRRAFFTWAGAMLLCAGFLTGMTLLIDGRYFPAHLMGGGGRSYSFWIAWSQFHHYAERFQSLLIIGAAWSICSIRSRPVFASAFAMSHLLGFLLAGGAGVDLNIFFNALAATTIACGLALSDLALALAGSRPSVSKAAPALMFAFFFIGIMIFVPGQLRRDRKMMRALPAHENEFHSAVEFVKAHPGPALCESLLLCYEAGKPFEFEPYSVGEMIKTGHLEEGQVLQLLRTHHFQAVEIALRSDEEDLNESDLRASLTSDQEAPDTERRFTPNFMKELLQDYQLSKRTSEMTIFCPK